MARQIKYGFTPDMGAMTRWAAEGAWQEQLAREMLIAGLEWLEQERREYIGQRFWRGWWDKQPIWLGTFNTIRFMNKQALRLELDATKGTQEKTRALHQALLIVMGNRITHRDASMIINTVEYTLMWIASNGWNAFVRDLRGNEKQKTVDMN